MEYDIFIVDDDQSFRMMMSKTLKSAGFNVDVAENGYDAFKKFLTHKYRLIIVDLKMPVMDGQETIKAIKKVNKDQPIVVISAYVDGHIRQEILDAGVYTFLTKPVDMDELLGIVQKIAGRPVSRR